MTVLLTAGKRLGAYEIEGHLASGGMGAVYSAVNVLTKEKRALKVVLPQLAAQPEFVQRFMREVRLAMMVKHPNLVTVFEPGLDGDTVFLPMELLRGESLRARLDRVRKLPAGEVVGLMGPIGSAVSALHEAGILHRDLKPTNVFLALGQNNACVPKVLDLGAARDVDLSEEMTSTGMAIGTPHYMSPEQGAGRKDIDARSDQYSLGVIAYQLLTGARPYESDSTGHALAKLLAGAPFKRPREVEASIPPLLEQTILRALDRSPDKRFANVTEFVSAMRGAIDDEKTIAIPVAPSEEECTRIQALEAPAPRPEPVSATAPPAVTPTAVARKAPGTWVAVGAIAVLIVAGGAWVNRQSAPTPISTAKPPATPSSAATVPLALGDNLPPPIVSPLPASTPPQAIASDAAPPPKQLPRDNHRSAPPASAPTTTAPPCIPSPGSPCF